MNLDQQLDSLSPEPTDPPSPFLDAVRRRRNQRRARITSATVGLALIALGLSAFLTPVPAPVSAEHRRAELIRPLGPRSIDTAPTRAPNAIPVGLRFDPDALADLAEAI